MKTKLLLVLLSLGVFILPSCVKSEGIDREADITSFSIEGEHIITSLLRNDINEVYIMVDGDYLSEFKNVAIQPEIEISESAVITPASGESVTLNDYSTLYTVKAADGGERVYLINVVPYVPLKMGFEDWFDVQHGKNKNRIYELPLDPLWINANEGVAKLYRDNTPFPTRKSTDKHPNSDGNLSVVLETVEGNESIVNIMNIPVYAGNIYRGVFDASVAMKDPLATTKFGQIHPKYAGKPSRLVTWYKYQSGKNGYTTWEYEPSTTRKKKVISVVNGKLDKPDVYAVLYKVPKGESGKNVFLTANDVKTSDRIIAMAFLEDTSEKSDWTKLDIPFTYLEEPNYALYDYKLTIVLSSSSDGANYRGAIGSILTVDDLEVICENIK